MFARSRSAGWGRRQNHQLVGLLLSLMLAENYFQSFIADKTVAEHCAEMGRDGFWGDHVELVAAGRAYARSVWVWGGLCGQHREVVFDAGSEVDKPPLQLLFSEEHYDSFRCESKTES